MRTEREVLLLGALSTIGWYLVSAVIFVIIPALSGRKNKKLFVSLSVLLISAGTTADVLRYNGDIVALCFPTPRVRK
jgi:hypothetical protein